MTRTLGRYRVDLAWIHPVWALTYGRWTYHPDEDARAWFLRARMGPVMVQVTKGRAG